MEYNEKIEDDAINICFLTDENYAMPTCVAVKSMLINKNKKVRYNIYALCNNLSDTSIKMIKELDSDYFKINIIKLENKYQEFYMDGFPVTPTAIHKFYIPEILNKIDKIIYLDGDVIVNSDLKELYQYDIGDNYLGAVKDINRMLKRHFNYFVKNKIFYFNSGVMLMNLKKMRADNVADKLLEYRANGYNKLMDQDALNVVLKDKVMELPFKYNTQTTFAALDMKIEKMHKYLPVSNTAKKYYDIIEDATIIHYTVKGKPWKVENGYKHDLWMNYYNLSPYGQTIINRKVEKKNKKIVNCKIFNVINHYKRFNFFKKFKKLN